MFEGVGKMTLDLILLFIGGITASFALTWSIFENENKRLKQEIEGLKIENIENEEAYWKLYNSQRRNKFAKFMEQGDKEAI